MALVSVKNKSSWFSPEEQSHIAAFESLQSSALLEQMAFFSNLIISLEFNLDSSHLLNLIILTLDINRHSQRKTVNEIKIRVLVILRRDLY